MRRVAMLVAVALMAACGSDGESGSSDDGGDPPEDTPTEEEERDLEADQALADSAMLTIDDVPAGYAEEPDDDDDEDDDELDQSFADCMDIPVSEVTESDDEPQASATFANDAGEEVSSEVIVYATEEEVQEDIAEWKDPAAQDCFADALNELAASNEEVNFGEITIEPLDVQGLGEDAFGFGLAMPFTADGTEGTLYLDVVFVIQGRTGISMGFQAFNAPFDEELGYELATIVVDRVPADA